MAKGFLQVPGAHEADSIHCISAYGNLVSCPIPNPRADYKASLLLTTLQDPRTSQYDAKVKEQTQVQNLG